MSKSQSLDGAVLCLARCLIRRHLPTLVAEERTRLDERRDRKRVYMRRYMRKRRATTRAAQTPQGGAA